MYMAGVLGAIMGLPASNDTACPDEEGIVIPWAVIEKGEGLFTGPEHCAVAAGSCTIVGLVFQAGHDTGCMPAG